MTFGASPYDLCPQETARYHVRNADGFTVAKFPSGYLAYDDAGGRSETGGLFIVVDTRDGSEYGRWENGVGA